MPPDANENPKYYLAITVDPLHIGSGEHRLGRVDNSIYREIGTNLPGIPASGLAGVARTGTAIEENNGKCAGKNDDSDRDPKNEQCGKPDCPVCVPYGYTKGDSSLHGMAQFHDARLLFFPVYSLLGPIWITCPSLLQDHCNEIINGEDDLSCRAPSHFTDKLPTTPDGVKVLNFGWLSLKVNGSNFNLKDISLKHFDMLPEKTKTALHNRTVLLPDSIFSRVVNANIEVRTSVSIDPMTGAAADGALFTYEAVPRGAIFIFSIYYNHPKYFMSNNLFSGETDDNKMKKVKDLIVSGLKMYEFLGLGAMNTRGFGRVKVCFHDSKETEDAIQ